MTGRHASVAQVSVNGVNVTEHIKAVTLAAAPAPTADQRIAAFARAWAEASILKSQGAYNLAFYRFWELACTAQTRANETAALDAAGECYELLMGPYVPKEFRS